MLKAPPPVWTALYLAIAWAAWRADLWPSAPSLRVVPLAAALFVAGFALAVWAVVLFRRARTEIEPTSEANRALVTQGPYRLTRNPMYLGLVLVSLGVAFLTGGWPFLLAAAAVFLTVDRVHIPFEEAKMRRQFGAAFDAYVRRVRRWI